MNLNSSALERKQRRSSMWRTMVSSSGPSRNATDEPLERKQRRSSMWRAMVSFSETSTPSRNATDEPEPHDSQSNMWKYVTLNVKRRATNREVVVVVVVLFLAVVVVVAKGEREDRHTDRLTGRY